MISNADILDACERLQTTAGRITPLALVELARSPKEKLHDAFEWDDQKAAAEHRLDQARALLARVRFEYQERDVVISVIAYVHDPKAADRQGYRSTVKLRDSREEAREAVADEITRILGCIDRAAEVAFALKIETQLGALRKKAEALLVELQS